MLLINQKKKTAESEKDEKEVVFKDGRVLGWIAVLKRWKLICMCVCVRVFLFFLEGGCLRQHILNVTFNFERRYGSLLIYFAFKRHFAQPTKHFKQQSSTDVTSRCAEEKNTSFSPFLTFTAVQTEWRLSAPPSTGPQTIRNVLFLLSLSLFFIFLFQLSQRREV